MLTYFIKETGDTISYFARAGPVFGRKSAFGKSDFFVTGITLRFREKSMFPQDLQKLVPEM